VTDKHPEPPHKPAHRRFRARFVSISWHDLAISIGPMILLAAIAVGLAIWLVRPAPPDSITFSAGPRGSQFWNTAEKYREILAQNGVKMELVESDGSLDNLRKLSNPAMHVDVGFVQGGVAEGIDIDHLVSLGSVAYVPLVVFCKSAKPLEQLSALKGKRIAVGPAGSGTRLLAVTLLKASGIEPDDSTQMLDIGGDDAAKALNDGQVDAIFLMGDSATPPTMFRLARTPGIHAMDFTQAQAYSRRYPYLNAVVLPMGVLDFRNNIPPADLHLLAPMAELVARDDLHPALSDLLIDAARQVNGGASVLQRAGEFPAPLQHEFRISDDAERYYSSGKSFLYRTLPFWLASLADRLLVIVVPLLVLLIPGMRIVPALYSWRIKSRLYRWYGALIALERSMFEGVVSDEERAEMLTRLDQIEDSVNHMKMPLAFADQFYVLREHIGFVKARLAHFEGVGKD